MANLIKNNEILIEPAPEKIIYAYTEYQAGLFDSISQVVPHVEFHDGIPDTDFLNGDQRTLIILDDLMVEISNNKKISNLFTRGCHHRSD